METSSFSALLFFIFAILIAVKWYLTLALIWISLKASDVGHLFMYLFVICIFSLVMVYFQVFCLFKKLDSLCSYYWV